MPLLAVLLCFAAHSWTPAAAQKLSVGKNPRTILGVGRNKEEYLSFYDNSHTHICINGTHANTCAQHPIYIPPHTRTHTVAGNDYQLVYSVAAYFEMNGIKGTVSITQDGLYNPAAITARLSGFPRKNILQNYDWVIREYPVRYSLLPDFPCSDAELGDVFDPLNQQVSQTYDVDCKNDTSKCAVGDLSGRVGYLLSNQKVQTFQYPGLQLRGPYSPVGRSIVIYSQQAGNISVALACANIERQGIKIVTLRASFQEPSRIQGEVFFRFVDGRSEVTIFADLYRLDGNQGENIWTLRESIQPGVCGVLYQVRVFTGICLHLIFGCAHCYSGQDNFVVY